MPSYALSVSLETDDYVYSINQSVYSSVTIKDNGTAVSNQSVSIIVKDSSEATSIAAQTFTTNSTGQSNYTFKLSTTGNYTLTANASGNTVNHFIKILPYEKILISLNKPSYATSTTAQLTAYVLDSADNGVASIGIEPNLRYKNGTLISSITSCTTDSIGSCTTTFTAPSTEGEYIVELNNFEEVVPLLVGGFSANMKISPGVVGKIDNVTIRVSVKNTNGNGVTASTRQLVITSPNGTETTVAAMTQATDSTEVTITGVYQDVFSSTTEGKYSVVATVTPQGSNLSKELKGSFEVRAYGLEVQPWDGQSIYYPGSSVQLGIKLKNATTGDNIAGKTTTITSGTTIYDPSGVDTTLSPTVSDQVTSSGKYRMDFTLPNNAQTGTYKVVIDINDTFGSGSGTGYFSVQRAKGKMVSFDRFPNGTTTRDFIAGKNIILRFSAINLSGGVAVTGVSSYTIVNEAGEDVTTRFGTNATYSSGAYTYINLTSPKNGGDYFIRAKVDTAAGVVTTGGRIHVAVLDLTIRPASVGGGGDPTPGAGGGGPGFFWFFRPNDTINLQVTVSTASEKEGHEGFMSQGSFGGGPSGIEGGLFGIGGGSNVQGAQVTLTKVINLNTEEDWTSSVTLTNCVTDSTGSCIVTMKSNVNGQNWTGGFYMAFFNVSTSDNKTDRGEGFFDVRRFFMDVRVNANTTTDASTLGFGSFNSWNIGPDTAINVSVTVREPGTWNPVEQSGNITVLGAYYGGSVGEFIFPPKLIDGSNDTFEILSETGTGHASLVIRQPTNGWKSGFYIVKVQANISGQLDAGEGFFMSRIFEGFGQPVNPETNVPDFTVGTTENVTLQVDVFNVVNYQPAANLTVSFSKILSFADFPPADLAYDKTVSQGTTDASGRVLMTLEPPTGGWGTGHFLAVFDVSNGTASDQVEGFFMVKNFFAELSTTAWRYGPSDNVNFTATISADPSWMRNQFGEGCPPEDTTCSSSGGQGGGGGGAPAQPQSTYQQNVVTFGAGFDLDSDTYPDINITNITTDGYFANISAANLTLGADITKNSSIAFMGCEDSTYSQCPSADKVLSNYESGSGPFTGFNCQTNFHPRNDSISYSNEVIGYRNISNMTTHGSWNASHTRYFCVNSTSGSFYKLGVRGPGVNSGTPENWTIEYIQDVGETGGFGGDTGVTITGDSSTSYFNASIKSLKVATFDFTTGETVLTEGTDYNVTSKDGSIKGATNLVIVGIGTFILKPLDSGATGTWAQGDYIVQAEFNNSLGTESAFWGFSVETLTVSCNRPSWGDVASGANITINCFITDPATGQPYSGSIQTSVESLTDSFTNSAVSTDSWSDLTDSAHTYNATMNITLSQSLSTGSYQIVLKINDSSTVKRSYIWFEVRDFTPVVWTDKWNYGTTEDVIINAEGTLSGAAVTLNVSYTGSTPKVTVYKYDRNTWARSVVSGVTVTTTNQTFGPNSRLYVNLSKSGGWDEGNYEVVFNLTKTTDAGVATGGDVSVNTWFDVRLFDVWSWSKIWTNHPKNNVTLQVHVESPGGGGYYNGNVIIDIEKLENTKNGSLLINGTDFSVLAVTANPSTRGDIEINITPLGNGLPTGQYKAKLKVTDANGASSKTDAWFETLAFNVNAYTENFEVKEGENVTVNVYSGSPTGGIISLTGLQITDMGSCIAGTCSNVPLTNFNYSFNHTLNKLYINTTGLSQGDYFFNFLVNDTQNATATSFAVFRIAAYAVSGRILYPHEISVNDAFRWEYQINETMVLNVTGTPGVNITNMTLTYWSCDGPCVYYEVPVTLGDHVLGTTQMTINITPPGVNNTWFTGPYGWVWYDIIFKATNGGEEKTLYSQAGVQFPGAWGRVTGPISVAPDKNISAIINVTLDHDNLRPLYGANISIKHIRDYITFNEVNSTSTNFTATINDTDDGGSAYINVTPNGAFQWPKGSMWIEYWVKYGNASTVGGSYVTVSQENFRIDKKHVYNGSSETDIFMNGNQFLKFVRGNGTTNANKNLYSEHLNISLDVFNPSATSVRANVTLTLPQHTTNASALAINHTNLTWNDFPIANSVAGSYNWSFNVTQSGNWTGTITIVPESNVMSKVTTTYRFESV
jgi:hypothetical protein